MADNIVAPATGVALATDDIGGVHYPRTKVAFGVNGVATDVSADAPLPVTVIGGGSGGGDATAANQDEQTAILANLLAALIATVTVDGEVSLSSATLTALETTELGAATLAALENIGVTGTVEIGSTSLAALETTELGAATLAALENITAELGSATLAALSTTELGATTLAALENITVAVPGVATDAKLDALISTTVLPAGTDRSGAIAVGGTAQQLAAANAGRVSLTLQNLSSGDLWINEIGGAAAVDTAGSWKVPAGGTYAASTNRAISIVGASAGQKFSATEI